MMQKQRLLLFFLLFFLLFGSTADPVIQIRSENWPPREDFEIWGYSVHVYFSPPSGSISSDVSTIIGIIEVSGQFEGYAFTIRIRNYGLYQDGEIIDFNYGEDEIFLSSLNTSWQMELPMEVPSGKKFSGFIQVHFFWMKLGGLSDEKSVKIETPYRKKPAASPLAGSLFLVNVFLLSIIIIVFMNRRRIHVSIFSGLRKTIWPEKEIKNILKPYLKEQGEFRHPSHNQRSYLPGNISMLNQRKQTLAQELNIATKTLEQFQHKIILFSESKKLCSENKIYSFITTNYREACLNRQALPDVDNAISRMKSLKRKLKLSPEEAFREETDVLFMWVTCENFAKLTAETQQILIPQLKIEEGVKDLVKIVKNYCNLQEGSQKSLDKRTQEIEVLEKKIISISNKQQSIKDYLTTWDKTSPAEINEQTNTCIKLSSKLKRLLEKAESPSDSSSENYLNRARELLGFIERDTSYFEKLRR